MFKTFQDYINPFFISVGVPENWLSEVTFWSALFSPVILIPSLIYVMIVYSYKSIKYIILWRNQNYLINDLHPFYTKTEIDKATRYYIPTVYQDTSPSQAEEPERSFITSPKALLIPVMLDIAFKDNGDKYYLILADSGMGKTTFIINLYLAYKKQWSWKRKYNIILLPLAHPKTFETIDGIKDATNTILLLDALDEDNEAVKDYQKRLAQIIDKTWSFRKIVITCRTQFFPKETEEPSKVGYFKYGPEGGSHNFRKQYISVFNNSDIKNYLRKQFSLFQFKKCRKASWLVKNSPNLMVRPMLLSSIKDLVNTDKTYDYSYQIYEALIQVWIKRESEKPGIEERYGTQENFKNKLYAFSCDLAKNIYFERDKREGRLSIHYTEQITTSSNIQLSDYEDLIKESDWRDRSLLNRDTDGRYKFSHKSILEYFLAKEAIENKEFFMQLNLKGMNATKSFIIEMALGELLINSEGTFTTKKSYPLSMITKKDCLNLSTLEITNASRTNLWCLSILFKISHRFTLILSDKTKLPILYYLYSFLLILVKRHNHLKSFTFRELPERLKLPELLELQERLELPELQERLELPELPELQRLKLPELPELQRLKLPERQRLERQRLERLERLKWLKPQRLERLERLELLELQKLQKQLERLELLELLELLKWFKLHDEDIFLAINLKTANNFIKECNQLQKKLPGVNIIY